jgi:hypothetical protein
MIILFSSFLIIPNELFAEEPGGKKFSNDMPCRCTNIGSPFYLMDGVHRKCWFAGDQEACTESGDCFYITILNKRINCTTIVPPPAE